ncbi:MAPK-interacting and spindle-stabilizing protein-like isoform X2 [Lacerta agilis]|uniref:MAPK-interacting and spindle-stabilizing protein-like isoform X2 n=1 Tax=Lacerta agilis TaxID=80427 RepID=UPI0014199D57|nr:MAPK-interacting and spindle-stabilizing protein-like isoform X2 [Lacerta agilis]
MKERWQAAAAAAQGSLQSSSSRRRRGRRRDQQLLLLPPPAPTPPAELAGRSWRRRRSSRAPEAPQPPNSRRGSPAGSFPVPSPPLAASPSPHSPGQSHEAGAAGSDEDEPRLPDGAGHLPGLLRARHLLFPNCSLPGKRRAVIQSSSSESSCFGGQVKQRSLSVALNEFIF